MQYKVYRVNDAGNVGTQYQHFLNGRWLATQISDIQLLFPVRSAKPVLFITASAGWEDAWLSADVDDEVVEPVIDMDVTLQVIVK